jgi:predicted dithiol-disulfide oxidoreductase (DUF899 family)
MVTKRTAPSKTGSAPKSRSGSKTRAVSKTRAKSKAKAPTALHAARFPGESRDYRKARNKLLRAEIDLRRRIEDVAALRRRLPPGGMVPEDYVFEEGVAGLDGAGGSKRVKLSELFVHDGASLIVYSFMYGPNMAKPCPMCTAMLDSLNGAAPHAMQRINLAVVASSPLERIHAFARERGWHNLRLLSSADNTYNQDYHAQSASGSQLPALTVFARRSGKTHHVFSTEMLYAPPERGLSGRHVDSIWPLWNLFDLTPEGRGKDWYPKLDYPA